MLIGRQVREACEILRWTRYDIQRRTGLPLVVVDLVMSFEDKFNGTEADGVILEAAFHRAGVEFTPEGLRLRKADKGEAN